MRNKLGIDVAYGYTSCTGCGEANDRHYTTVFPAWGCLIDDIDTTPRETFGITTQNGSNDCECHFAQIDGFDIPNAMMPRFPHYCEFNEEDDSLGPGVNSCACSMSYEHLRDGLCPSTNIQHDVDREGAGQVRRQARRSGGCQAYAILAGCVRTAPTVVAVSLCRPDAAAAVHSGLGPKSDYARVPAHEQDRDAAGPDGRHVARP